MNWTPGDDWMLRAYYPHIQNADLARRLGRTACTVARRAYVFGIGKSELFFASPASGRLQPLNLPPKPKSNRPNGIAWTAEEEARLRAIYPTCMSRNLAGQFGERSVAAIKSRASVLKLKKTRERKKWTAADDWMMRAYFPHLFSKDIARRLGCTKQAAEGHAHKIGIHKSPMFLQQFCRLQKGSVPPNKGKRGRSPANKGMRRPGYSMGRGRMAQTTFKKGQHPHNTMPLWSFRINTDGYLLLKTGKPGPKPNSGWEWVHKLVWEHEHGPVPKGYRIWWKDKDRLNNSLANLELLSGRDHMQRNTIHNPKFPAQLREVIYLKGHLKRRLNTLKKKKLEKEKANAKEHDGRSQEPPVCHDRSVAG